MKSDTILAVLEEAAQLIARLDARISASPLAEAWQVRASFLAAERLAAVDGTPTRSADILGLITDTPLPSPASYRPATYGFAHWRRCMARVELSDLASRLIGREPSTSRKAEEDQLEWDNEDAMSAAARVAIAKAGTAEETIDDYALAVSERALKQLRNLEPTGSVFKSLALGLQAAIRVDPDPNYFERVDRLRRSFEAGVRLRAAEQSPLPSPSGSKIDERAEGVIASVNWDKKPHIGSCFSVVPDRLREMGVTSSRLSCLTGATKRLAFEGRMDDRAFVGFLRALSAEAKAGLALLDGLEKVLAEFARSPSLMKVDPRSPLPDIIYAFLLFPAVDSVWLQSALELKERVTNKLIKQLVDAGLLRHWADRRITGDGEKTRDVRLWAASTFEKDFELALKRRAWAKPGSGMTITPAEMLARHQDLNVSVPMAVVYERFDNEIIDLDREFGRFFERKGSKNRPPRRLTEGQNETSMRFGASRGLKALLGP